MDRRRYPARPLPAASVALVDRGRILLVRRRFEPGRGLWSIPGGLIELGEKAVEAALRELREETGVEAEVDGLLDVVDVIVRDGENRVEWHYLIVVFKASNPSGEVRCSGESSEVGWFSLDEALTMNLTKTARRVVEKLKAELKSS